MYIVAVDREKSVQPKTKNEEDEFGDNARESLLSLVQPELPTLSQNWFNALKDHAYLSLPPGKIRSAPLPPSYYYDNEIFMWNLIHVFNDVQGKCFKNCLSNRTTVCTDSQTNDLNFRSRFSAERLFLVKADLFLNGWINGTLLCSKNESCTLKWWLGSGQIISQINGEQSLSVTVYWHVK